MSLAENAGNMVMPVGPMYGNGGNMMGWGDGSFWIIVLFLFALMGNGWGNGFGGNGGGAMPYVISQNADSTIQRGFDQQAVVSGIAGVQNAVNGLAQNQCAGFAGVNTNMNQGFSSAEISANARQMANMQQTWNAQTAIDQRLDTLAMNQQAIGCENRQAIGDVKYAIATDGAATRANTDAKVQAVMDKLCQLELDGIKQNYENRIAGMQNQIDSLQYQVNNADRNVALANEVDALYNRLNSCPVPTTPVYGRTPIFTCNQTPNYGGCGCGAVA